MTGKNIDLANELRATIQSRTDHIDDGEAVAMVLLFSFLLDHAKCCGMDVEKLAVEQLDAFIPWARENMRLQATQ
jgi:hypothetical protein